MALFKLFIFIIIAGQLTGCVAIVAGGAAGAGAVVYVKGELQEDINASATRVHRATVVALKQLDLPLIENAHDKMSSKIKSRFADGDDVWIDIEAVTSESSKITIRVGIMGNENKARTILSEMHKYL